MPHQRKYVAHSGGIDAYPSRAKRSMAAYASHGFSSRLSRSARCALLSFTSLTLASVETEAGDGSFRCSLHVLQRNLHPRFTARALRDDTARRGLHAQDRVADDHLVLAAGHDLRAAHGTPALLGRRRHHAETIYS